jgi:NDP-sugar pyrophosphorylase family protein
MTDRAVILAGGKGSRLAPYTTVLPKPLLPIGDRSILDVVLRQLAGAGLTDVTIAVGHLAHLVRAVVGDGSHHGARVEYLEEDEPLGTAGSLARIERLDGTFLAMNGDILTTLDPRRLIAAHLDAGNAMTIASHRRAVKADYGVLELDGDPAGDTRLLTGYREKPETSLVVSMGIYVLEPRALAHIPPDGAFDIPRLVLALLAAGEPVGSFLYDGYWLDVGRHDDYELAIAEFEELLPQLLPREAPVQ